MRSPRNIALCFDGTWNSDEGSSPTNVVKTSRALAPSTAGGVRQVRYYDRGVGTGRFDRVRGGVVGLGLARNVELAWIWLCATRRRGDRVFLFGYSRGAYTARSLAGLIGLCGIPDPERCLDAGRGVADVARQGMAIYRLPSGDRRSELAAWYRERWAAGGAATSGRQVHFVGAWDTVGALGIPINALNWIGARRHRFHDVTLGRHIRHACHAVAIDERRRPFAPTLWQAEPAAGQTLEQVWFPGVHSDVGGGRQTTALSDGALLWMWSRAWSAGLAVRASHAARLKPDPLGSLGDSLSLLYRLWAPRDRQIGRFAPGGEAAAAREAVHFSALRRVEAVETRSYRSGVAGRTLLPALERGLVAEAERSKAETCPASFPWDAPPTEP